jgi:hypothetical protein
MHDCNTPVLLQHRVIKSMLVLYSTCPGLTLTLPLRGSQSRRLYTAASY